jgi:hypothetical protein
MELDKERAKFVSLFPELLRVWYHLVCGGIGRSGGNRGGIGILV